MPKKVLVTGAAGFTGRHMCSYLKEIEQNLHIIATDIVLDEEICCDEYVVTDLSSNQECNHLIKQTTPDYVIHLAGTFNGEKKQLLLNVNILSIMHLLDAVQQNMHKSVFIATGSAAEYGKVSTTEIPVTEDLPCRPITTYGLSKFLATQLALYHERKYNNCIMIVRPFQLIGKGVSSNLAPGTFAQQLKNATAEGSTTVKVGNLETFRDFLDVRDAVRAIWILCQKPATGHIFNLCSGKPTKIRDLLSEMIGQSKMNVTIQEQVNKLRSEDDVPMIYGSFEKIKEHCGWQPKITLGESIRSMFTNMTKI
jgi:GDP-4-dehydro-6-deoxy-D-mannose reductase